MYGCCHHCYVLLSRDGRASYAGTTNNLDRRLRQHNGMRSGGARYTTRRRRAADGSGGDDPAHWRYLFVVSGFAGRSQALQ